VNELRLENDELHSELLAAEEARRLVLRDKESTEQFLTFARTDIEYLNKQVTLLLL